MEAADRQSAEPPTKEVQVIVVMEYSHDELFISHFTTCVQPYSPLTDHAVKKVRRALEDLESDYERHPH